jgi:uncharacterized protein YaaN involved in tellurite resistance
MKKVKLTEKELTNIIKKIVREDSFNSDNPGNSGNEVYDKWYNSIDKFYDRLGRIETMDDVDEIYNAIYRLTAAITRDERLSDDEIDRLMDEWTGIFEDLRAIEADMKDDM